MKWYAPSGKDLTKTGVNKSDINTFSGQILSSLAREVAQNSLDVVQSGKSLEMVFECKLIEIDKIPEINFFIDEAIPKSRVTWEEDKDVENFVNNFYNSVKKQDIPVLRISDYNTTGLEPSNWDKLIDSTAASLKSDDNAGGSFGIGKAAPFAASGMRMVFYETLVGSKFKSIGVCDFPSYRTNVSENIVTEGKHFLGQTMRKPREQSFNFGFEERERQGTDIYVVDFISDPDWENTLIRSLLISFMYTIYLGKVSFIVQDTKINHENLKELLYKFRYENNNVLDKEVDKMINYYNVLEDPNNRIFYLDKRFEKYGFKEEDAILYLNTSEEANRSVLMTRQTGMSIFDRKNINGSIQFNGIFHATGREINRVLRKMENPQHDKWEYDRYTDNPKWAKKLLVEFGSFFRESVKESFGIEPDEVIDAFGTADFLPDKLNRASGLEIKEDKIITSVKIKGFSRTGNDMTGSKAQSQEGKHPVNPGDRSGRKRTKKSSGQGADGKALKYLEEYNYRIVEINSKMGIYELVFIDFKKASEVKISILIEPEEGRLIPVKLRLLSEDNNEKLMNNMIYISELVHKEPVRVKFEIGSHQRRKMAVLVYEVK